jgi:hypothetical protein
MSTTTLSTNIGGLLGTLQAQLESKRDIVIDTRRVSLGTSMTDRIIDTVAVLDLKDGAEEFGIRDYAHRQIASHLDIPWKTYERIGKHLDLREHLCNGLLQREPSTRFVRVLDGEMRAFLSNGYRPRDNWDLMAALMPVIQEFPTVEFKECSLTETRMYVKMFLPDFELPVTPKVGDVVRGGVIISNSEVGNGALGIFPYTDNLICTNGMVHTEFGQRSVHLGRRIEASEEAFEWYSDETIALDDAAFYAKCADTLRGCLNETVFEAIVSQMRDLAEIKIGGAVPQAVEVVSKKQNLTESEGEAMLRNIIERGDLTGWGFVSGITATARDLENRDRAVELETLAGRMTADPSWTRELVEVAA